MRNVHVELGSKSYDIVIDRGLLPHVGSRIKTLLPKVEKVAVITDSNVGPLYASLLQESLEPEKQAKICKHWEPCTTVWRQPA